MDDNYFSTYAIISLAASGITIWFLNDKIKALYDEYGVYILWGSILIFILGGVIFFFSHLVIGSRVLSATLGAYMLLFGASASKISSWKALPKQNIFEDEDETHPGA